MLHAIVSRAVVGSSEESKPFRATERATLCGTMALMLTLPLAAGARTQTNGPPANSAATGESEGQIRAVLDAQVAAWNRGDVLAFMQGYWKSPQTEFVGSSGIVRGWQPVLDRYRKAYPDRAAMGHLEFSGFEVQVLGPDAALVVGHFRLQRQNDASTGVFTLIFRKFPEGWRIIHDHTSATALQ